MAKRITLKHFIYVLKIIVYEYFSFPEARVNGSCFFTEQCEHTNSHTECKDGICICRHEKQAIFKPDGTVECVGK